MLIRNGRIIIGAMSNRRPCVPAKGTRLNWLVRSLGRHTVRVFWTKMNPPTPWYTQQPKERRHARHEGSAS